MKKRSAAIRGLDTKKKPTVTQSANYIVHKIYFCILSILKIDLLLTQNDSIYYLYVMKLKEAKELFKMKIIHSPRIDFTDKGWVLKFKADKKPSCSLTMEAERGGIRYYRGVRGALNACVKIGCPNAYVKLPKSKKIIIS